VKDKMIYATRVTYQSGEVEYCFAGQDPKQVKMLTDTLRSEQVKMLTDTLRSVHPKEGIAKAEMVVCRNPEWDLM